MDFVWKQLCCARLADQESQPTKAESKNIAGQEKAKVATAETGTFEPKSQEFSETVLAQSSADSSANPIAPHKDVSREQAAIGVDVVQTQTGVRTMESKSEQLQAGCDTITQDAEVRTDEADKFVYNFADAGKQSLEEDLGNPLEVEHARQTETHESESNRFGSEPLPDSLGVLEVASAIAGKGVQDGEAWKASETGSNGEETLKQGALERAEGADDGKTRDGTELTAGGAETCQAGTAEPKSEGFESAAPPDASEISATSKTRVDDGDLAADRRKSGRMGNSQDTDSRPGIFQEAVHGSPPLDSGVNSALTGIHVDTVRAGSENASEGVDASKTETGKLKSEGYGAAVSADAALGSEFKAELLGKGLPGEDEKPDVANQAGVAAALQASNSGAEEENREQDAATKIQARARGNSLRTAMNNETF